MVFTAILGLAVLTGMSQAQQEEPSTGLSNAVDINDDSSEPEDLEQNVENMLKLLGDLENDREAGKELNIPGEEKMDQKMAEQPGDPMPSNTIPPLTPIEKKVKKNHIEPANEVVKFVPEDPGSHFRLGMDYWRSNNLDAAIQHFEEVVRLDPENAHAFWNLSILYEKMNKGSEALNNAIKAKAIYSKYDYSLYVAQAQERLQKLSTKFKK